jgi:predicted Zn-dependent protease
VELAHVVGRHGERDMTSQERWIVGASVVTIAGSVLAMITLSALFTSEAPRM